MLKMSLCFKSVSNLGGIQLGDCHNKEILLSKTESVRQHAPKHGYMKGTTTLLQLLKSARRLGWMMMWHFEYIHMYMLAHLLFHVLVAEAHNITNINSSTFS